MWCTFLIQISIGVAFLVGWGSVNKETDKQKMYSSVLQPYRE